MYPRLARVRDAREGQERDLLGSTVACATLPMRAHGHQNRRVEMSDDV